MNEPLSLHKHKPLTIIETTPGLFSMFLPVCNALVLHQILDPKVPWITLLNFCPSESATWIEQHLPPLFEARRRIESVNIKRLEMDVSLSTTDLLRILSQFESQGLHLVQGIRPLPSRISMDALKLESVPIVFRQVGISLEFHLPHAHEHAVVTASSRSEIERTLRALTERS